MSYFEDLSLRDVWVATSGDDGKTWRYPAEVPHLLQAVEPDGEGGTLTNAYLAVQYPDGMPVVRTPDNLTLVGIEHQNYIYPPNWTVDAPAPFWRGKPDSGARAALIVMNYNAAGTAEPEEGSVVFKRTKPSLI